MYHLYKRNDKSYKAITDLILVYNKIYYNI